MLSILFKIETFVYKEIHNICLRFSKSVSADVLYMGKCCMESWCMSIIQVLTYDLNYYPQNYSITAYFSDINMTDDIIGGEGVRYTFTCNQLENYNQTFIGNLTAVRYNMYSHVSLISVIIQISGSYFVPAVIILTTFSRDFVLKVQLSTL